MHPDCTSPNHFSAIPAFGLHDDAIKQLQNYHADKLILSVDGIDPDNGFSTYYDKESEIARIMIEQSDCCIIVADSSKLYHTAFAKISDIDVADCIITNEPPTDEFLKRFSESGIDVLIT